MSIKPMVRLSRFVPGKREYVKGLELLHLELIEDGKTVHNLHVQSGQPGCQYFRHYNDPASYPGNMEPIPQGWYECHQTVYAINEIGQKIYNEGIGEWCTPLTPRQVTIRRSEFLVHEDYNRPNSPGTAGCAGLIYSDHSKIWRTWRDKWPGIISWETQWGIK